jgi:DNA modification methylase
MRAIVAHVLPEAPFMSRQIPPRIGSAVPPRAPWRSRIVEHADVAPELLLGHPLNFRRHPAAQRRSLTAVLGDVGWVASVMVNRRNGRVLDGHARLEEAIARGEATVPVDFVDLDEDEERLILATFDAIGSLAEADPAALAELLAQLSTADADLAELLETLAASAGSPRATGFDPDSAPARPDTAATYVRPGQGWQLGRHRILCGDALDPVAVGRLLAGERPTLLVTDPPYGVELDLARRHALAGRTAGGTSRGAGHRRVRLAGDERADWSAAFELVPSLAVGYLWHPALRVAEVIAGLERIGFELVSQIVWAKSRWAVGPRWYHWQHETCLVVRRRGVRTRFLGGRDQGTVWEAPSPKVGGPDADPKVDHPSQKPVVLFERPIRNHVPPGGLVYDPFLGSGTALVAAERAHRRCLGMELDPGFVQVAIERWQALTGVRAELVDEAGA